MKKFIDKILTILVVLGVISILILLPIKAYWDYQCYILGYGESNVSLLDYHNVKCRKTIWIPIEDITVK